MLENSLGHHYWMKFTWSTDGTHPPMIHVMPVKPGRRAQG